MSQSDTLAQLLASARLQQPAPAAAAPPADPAASPAPPAAAPAAAAILPAAAAAILPAAAAAIPPAPPAAAPVAAAIPPAAAPVAAAIPPAAAPVAAAIPPSAAPAAPPPPPPVIDTEQYYTLDLYSVTSPAPLSRAAVEKQFAEGKLSMVCPVGGQWQSPDTLGLSRPRPVAEQAVAVRPPMQVIKDPTAALQALAAMTRVPAANIPSMSRAVAAASVGFGPAHPHPFANLSEGVWDAYVPRGEVIHPLLPDGKRPVDVLFLGARYGATGWIGASNRGAKNGKPPAWRFALPTVVSGTVDQSVLDAYLAAAKDVQMTAKEAKVKFDRDDLGRLTPEIHLLCWRRIGEVSGLIVLSVGGYAALERMSERIDIANAGQILAPLRLTIETWQIVNKKVYTATPTAENASWNASGLLLDIVSDPSTQQLKRDWDAAMGTTDAPGPAAVEVANAMSAFHLATDFKGLPLSDVLPLLSRYANIRAGH